MEKSTTFSAPFARLLLQPGTKILSPIISFRVKATYIDNQYDLYSITCAYGSSMVEVVDFTISYSPVEIIKSLRIIMSFSSEECLMIFILDIYNAFQNTI